MPRLGVGMPITAGLSQEAVTSIDDFFFESFSAGEMHPILTTSRTNLLTYSEDFSQGIYSRVRSTLTPNDIVSPDGSANGSKLEADVTGNSGSWTNALVTSYSGGHTISVFAKKGTTEFLLITEVYPNGAVFNLDNGTVKQVSSGSTASISDEGNGWFRCSYSFNAASATKAFFIVGNSNTSITLHSATDGNNLYLFGAQLEQDSFVSAYIPTSGSTVTVSTTLNDTSEVWDFDSTDITLEADPEDEGFWEEGSNLVLNHDYGDISQNFVENSTFETEFTSSQWNAFSSVTTLERSTEQAFAGSHSLKIVGADTKGVQASATQFGDDYEIGDVVEIIAYVYPTISPNNAIKTGVNNSDRSITTLFTGLTLNQWNEIKYQVTITTDANNYISFLNSGTGEFYLDNVSARIIDPNRRWVSEADWTIEDGVAKGNGASGSSEELRQDGILTVGDTYEFTFTIQDYSSGSVELMNNGLGSLSSNGVHTGIGVAASTDLRFRGSSFNGSIDNVTVREYAVQPKDI